jgi:hypothetical protein
MYTLCWSPKGGSGTTVVAAAIALVSARSQPVTLIDLGGDCSAALGVAEPAGPGIADWFASPRAPAERLLALAAPVAEGLALVHPGAMPLGRLLGDEREERLAATCSPHPTPIIIDAGPYLPGAVLHQCAQASLLVLRPCYLALRRAQPHATAATGVILIHEPGRALTTNDVERAIGRPVVGEVAWDPAIARAVDAGLLGTRLPSSLARPLVRLPGAVAAV